MDGITYKKLESRVNIQETVDLDKFCDRYTQNFLGKDNVLSTDQQQVTENLLNDKVDISKKVYYIYCY